MSACPRNRQQMRPRSAAVLLQVVLNHPFSRFFFPPSAPLSNVSARASSAQRKSLLRSSRFVSINIRVAADRAISSSLFLVMHEGGASATCALERKKEDRYNVFRRQTRSVQTFDRRITYVKHDCSISVYKKSREVNRYVTER